MVKLLWGITGERLFEAGIDRGVLYPENGNGVAWNGITSVRENPTGGGPRPFYFDGFKYLNLTETEEYQATLEAFSAPSEFAACDGTAEVSGGLFVTQQPRRPFGLSYRTLVGNDVSGSEYGYKIHLVYNAMAAPAGNQYDTLNDNPQISPLSWSISTTPTLIPGQKPAAHLVIDSRRTDPVVLGIIEGYLYGSDGLAPRLPSAAQLASWMQSMDDPSNRRPWNDIPGRKNLLGITDGTYSTIRNRVLNPRGRKPYGSPITLRTNLVSDPRGSNWFTGPAQPINTLGLVRRWYGSGAAGTDTSVTAPDGPEGIPSYRQIKITTPGGLQELGFNHSHASNGGTALDTKGYPVAPGEVYTSSLYVRSRNVDAAAAWRHVVYYRTADGSLLSSVSLSYTPVSSEWQRVSATFTVPPYAVYMGLATYLASSASSTVDTVVEATGYMVEKSNKLGEYFDGGYWGGDPDFTPVWNGVASGSPSKLTAIQPRGIHALVGGVAYYSKTRDSFAFIKNNSTARGELTIIADPANVTTTFLTQYLDPIPVGARARSTRWSGIPSQYDNYKDISVDPLVRTVQTTGSRYVNIIDLLPTAPEGTYYARLGIFAGEYDGPYFDGDTPEVVYEHYRLKPEWDGTPDEAESMILYSENLPARSNDGDMMFTDWALWVQQDGLWGNVGSPPSFPK